MFSERDRGVSSVVGVVLVVAVVAAIAAVVGTMTLGVTDQLPDETPTNVAYDGAYVADGTDNANRPYVVVTVTAGRVSLGDETTVVDEAGNRVNWAAVWSSGEYLEAGETFRIDGVNNANGADGALERPCDQETYRVVRQSTDTQSGEVVMRVTAGVAAPGATGC